MEQINIAVGCPFPFGTSRTPQGVNFALFAPNASQVLLKLGDRTLSLEPSVNRTGDVWHIHIDCDDNGFAYSYLIDGQETSILDPYSRGVSTTNVWSAEKDYQPQGWVPQKENFDWQNDRHPNIPLKDLIIYEMHVRGFTQDPSASCAHPGTFLGLIEKIPHLLSLGINAVELLPVFEFNEAEYTRIHPETEEKLCNYWGYSTVNYFSPMLRYASSPSVDTAIQEFKLMVRELHRHGIEVLLDVVYNHTSEGNELGPAYCYKALAENSYYIKDPNGKLANYTGCGNTFNSNHPLAWELILQSLRYWYAEMHVDGFRFDLASIHYRGTDGNVLSYAPLIEAISLDPVLSSCKLIAEPWDAVGLYQVGSFSPNSRWSEWNAAYRDSIRKFLKGRDGHIGDFATRIAGSEDLYPGKQPTCSLNFVTCHDGFTLRDLVSYNHKHNKNNGENNEDGNPFNDSWNCGIEGPTNDSLLLALRERQMRNFHVALMLSQGIPMLHMGDEYGHTKRGNNNTWCQDNALNWFQWHELAGNQAFFRFYSMLIHFRRNYAPLRMGRFLTTKDITWYSAEGTRPSWNDRELFLGCMLKDPEKKQDFYAAFNPSAKTKKVQIPSSRNEDYWKWLVNTGAVPPADIYECDTAPILDSDQIEMAPYSAIILIS